MRRRIIIAGSRDLAVTNQEIQTWIDWIMRAAWPAHVNWDDFDPEIVSGGARGVDACGERFSREVFKSAPKIFPADWTQHGKAAGSIRNGEMARYANAAIVFVNGAPTPGSANMFAWMGLLEKPARIVQPGQLVPINVS